MRRVLVDQGSTVEIMYPDLYNGLNLKSEDLTAYASLLISFKGKTVIPKGQIRLPIQTDSEVVEVDFIVVDSYSPYTAIVARPWLHTLGAVSFTLHQKVKYPSKCLVKEILGNQSIARQCMVAAILHKPEVMSSDPTERPSLQLRTSASSGGRPTEGSSCEDLERMIIDTDPEKFFQIGAQLPTLEKQALIEFLRDNVDIFAWDACKAPGIDSNFICHHLNVNPSIIPRKQPPRRSSEDHYEAVKEEVTKLKRVGAIKEVYILSGWPTPWC